MVHSQQLSSAPLPLVWIVALLIAALAASCTRAGFEREEPGDAATTTDQAPIDGAPGPDLPPPADLGAPDQPGPIDAPSPSDHAADHATYLPPVITGLTFKRACLPQQQTVTINVAAIDPAGGALAVTWSSNAGGSFKGSGFATSYTPPLMNYTCAHGITVKVTSGKSKLSTSQVKTLKVTRRGDLNQDGVVNMTDQGLYASHSGKSGCCLPAAPCHLADLNNDCLVDAADFGILNANWLKTGCACTP